MLVNGSVMGCSDNPGKYKLAHLDPPYNTGSQFCYSDRMSRRSWRYWFQDVASNVYRALSDDGVLCVSIDDHEQHTVRSVLDDRFVFQATIVVENNPVGRHMGHGFAGTHEYLHVYTKSEKSCLITSRADQTNPDHYPHTDEHGTRFRMIPLQRTNKRFNKSTRPTMHFPITLGGVEHWPKNERTWRWSRSKVERDIDRLHIWRGQVCERDDYSPDKTTKLRSVWTSEEIGSTAEAVKEMESRFGARVFETPKPSRLLKRILGLVPQPGPVLDGFCGSGAMMQACMDLGYECDSYQISEPLDRSKPHHQELIRWCELHGLPLDVQSLARWRFSA